MVVLPVNYNMCSLHPAFGFIFLYSFGCFQDGSKNPAFLFCGLAIFFIHIYVLGESFFISEDMVYVTFVTEFDLYRLDSLRVVFAHSLH